MALAGSTAAIGLSTSNPTSRAQNAITREKQLKRWNRAKVWLIERVNRTWEDLSAEWGKPIGKIEQQVPPLAS
jgi:predicted GIY-YIG superfamily endonuclease